MTTINLPLDGKIVPYTLTGTPIALAKRDAKAFPRIAFAAALSLIHI